jgi:gas vesicle protein
MREYALYEEPGESEASSEGNRRGNSIGWFLMGIGIGAAAALLFAPATGGELRSAVAHGYRRTMNGVSRGTRQLRRHGSNLINFQRRSI